MSLPVSGAAATAAELARRVLYRDRLVVVFDKPAGLPCHAGPSGGPSVEDILPALTADESGPPLALAHRLDTDTAGCLVLGRGAKGVRRLGRLFAEGRVEKVYWAVARGRPAGEAGRIDLPLAKVAGPRGWKIVADRRAGRPAVTDWRLLGTGEGRDGPLCWLDCRPRSGRTHQIRVHLQVSGCPILGDPFYGTPAERAGDGPGLHLLARAVTLPFDDGRPPIHVEAPVPKSLRAALAACGWTGT
jgi:RluA family pseudouridine synthase